MTVYLTVQEAALLARCNPATIRRRVKAGQLSAIRPDGRRLLLLEQDVRAWVEHHRVPPDQQPARPATLRRVTPGSVAVLKAMEPR